MLSSIPLLIPYRLNKRRAKRRSRSAISSAEIQIPTTSIRSERISRTAPFRVILSVNSASPAQKTKPATVVSLRTSKVSVDIVHLAPPMPPTHVVPRPMFPVGVQGSPYHQRPLCRHYFLRLQVPLILRPQAFQLLAQPAIMRSRVDRLLALLLAPCSERC